MQLLFNVTSTRAVQRKEPPSTDAPRDARSSKKEPHPSSGKRPRVGQCSPFRGPGDERSALFKRLDHDQSGVVHYHEFLAATLEAEEGVLDPETLQDTFDRMDNDDTGVISKDNIRQLLGTRASDALVDRMIADGDVKRNGVVDFDEFAALMTSPPPTPADSTVDLAAKAKAGEGDGPPPDAPPLPPASLFQSRS